jgi:hypothetical protein
MPKGMTDPPEGELKHSLRTSANLDKETMMLKYQDRIENVIAAYEQLIESRESLLLRRGKVRTSAIRVQAKRIDTGNTEVELMDRLRVWMSSINQNIPSVVSEAYTNLVTKRNDLAVSEDNYLQAERQLTGIEWSHIDEDSDFYQFDLKELLADLAKDLATTARADGQGAQHSPEATSHDHPPSPQTLPQAPVETARPVETQLDATTWSEKFPAQYESQSQRKPKSKHWSNAAQKSHNPVPQELLGLADGIRDLRDVQPNIVWDKADSDFFLNHVSTLGQSHKDDRGKDVQNLEELFKEPTNLEKAHYNDSLRPVITSTSPRRESAPATAPFSGVKDISFDVISKGYTETAVSAPSKDPWAGQRITSWLEEHLEANAVERTIRTNELREVGLINPSGNAWKNFISRDYDLPENDHTESLSDESVSQSLSTGDNSNPSVQIEDVHPELECPSSVIGKKCSSSKQAKATIPSAQEESKEHVFPPHSLPTVARESARWSTPALLVGLQYRESLSADYTPSRVQSEQPRAAPTLVSCDSKLLESQQCMSTHIIMEHPFQGDMGMYNDGTSYQPPLKDEGQVLNIRANPLPHETIVLSHKSRRPGRLCILD